MIKPSIEELTSNGLNRYEVVVACAKCARILTEEYCEKRAIAEKLIANKETDKSLAAILKTELSDERAVTNAVRRIYNGEFEIIKEAEACQCEQSEENTEVAEPTEADNNTAEATENIAKE
ncbi:MAG: hypothetical protein UHG68_11060 [Clostridia bacterium]|nr:hypothetical protein [Clostridia bacterium]